MAVSILVGADKTRSPLMIISGGIIVTALSTAISYPFVICRKRKAENMVYTDKKGAASI